MRDYFYYDDDDVSIYDVVKVLTEQKLDKHAVRVIKVIEELKYLQGRMEAYMEKGYPKLVTPPEGKSV